MPNAMAEERDRQGQLIGDRFLLERKLGSGGFGSVWLAEDGKHHSQVALKLLHEKFLRNAWVLDRFEREAEVLSRLVHENIARPVAWRITPRFAYLAMEYAPGRSLDLDISDHAAARTPFEPETIVRMMRQLCAAMDYAHGQDVVHRDLKPKNVQLAGDGDQMHVKVLDFGVAKMLSDSSRDATTVGRLLGSLLYMSPEQAISAPVDHRADIFSLGSVLFELLTLKRPWAWDAGGMPIPALDQPIRRTAVNNHLSILRRIATAKRPVPSASMPGLSPEIDALVLQAIAIAPRQRFDSAGELAQALEAALLDPVVPVSASAPDRARDTVVDAAPTGAATVPHMQHTAAADGEGPADDEMYTTVMPKDHDASDRMGDATKTGAQEPTHTMPMDAQPLFGAVTPSHGYAPYITTGSLVASRGKISAGTRQLLTLVVGVALGAVVAVVALRQRAEPPPVIAPVTQPPAPGPPTAVGQAALEPKAAPAASPTPAKVEPVQRRPNSRAKPEPQQPAEVAAEPYGRLRAKLRKARANPEDAHLIEALSTEIQRAAAALPQKRAGLVIRRRATTSAMIGDLDGLSACIDQLAAASQ